jgi:hypothetical protein
MASYLEMQKLANMPGAVTMLAGYLRGLETVEWSEWELDFLDSMAARDSREPISTRQREVLTELNNNAKSFATVDGISVPLLVHNCFIARIDLDEADADFIATLQATKVTSLKRRSVMRLLACARQLHLIDGYVDLK